MAWTFNSYSDTSPTGSWKVIEAVAPFGDFVDTAGVSILTANSSRIKDNRWILQFDHDIQIPAGTPILPQIMQVYLMLTTAVFHGYDGSANFLKWPLQSFLGYVEDGNQSHFEASVNNHNFNLIFQGTPDTTSETLKRCLIDNESGINRKGELIDANVQNLSVSVSLVGYGVGTPGGTPKGEPSTDNSGIGTT